ncbi:MAG: MoaD/ThiS family protein [Bacteroidota bacterium]
MHVEIILFGQLADIAGSSSIVVNDVSGTDALAKTVNILYPGMAAINYLIAVDKKIAREDTALSETNLVALLPPFSGG